MRRCGASRSIGSRSSCGSIPGPWTCWPGCWSPAAVRGRGHGQRRAHDLGQQQLRHGGDRPRARRPVARGPWGIQWVKEGPYNQIAQFPAGRGPRGRSSCSTASRRSTWRTCWPAWTRWWPAPASTSSAATSRPASSRCTGGCAAWSRRCSTSRADPELAEEMFRRCARFRRAAVRGGVPAIPAGLALGGRRRGRPAVAVDEPGDVAPADQAAPGPGLRGGQGARLWVAYHCCGALRPIIPDLIEIGLDVLNPVQCNCPGMDPLELKREFGRDLLVHGRRGHAGPAALRHARTRCAGPRGG